MARRPPRRRAAGRRLPVLGARRRTEHAGASTSIASGARTPIPSTAPRTRRRSCCARTSSRPVRSSKTTGRARSICSASRASSCSTRSRARTCCASSATAIQALATEVARGQHRAMLAWCSVDPRLLPVCVVPLGDMPAAVALARGGDRRRRGRAPDRPVLPARSLAEPRRPRAAVGDGRGSGRAGRAARRGRGRAT